MAARRRSRLPTRVQRRLSGYFVAGTPAGAAAELAGVHRNSAALFYRELREVTLERTREAQPSAGEAGVDESCFGAGKKQGPPGRGAAGKVPVFGLLKRGGRVHAAMIPNVRGAAGLPIIRERVRPDAVVYSDGYARCRALDAPGFRHVRVDKSRAYARGRAQSTASRTSGAKPSATCGATTACPAGTSPLFQAECEWRLNEAPPGSLLKMLREWMAL